MLYNFHLGNKLINNFKKVIKKNENFHPSIKAIEIIKRTKEKALEGMYRTYSTIYSTMSFSVSVNFKRCDAGLRLAESTLKIQRKIKFDQSYGFWAVSSLQLTLVPGRTLKYVSLF